MWALRDTNQKQMKGVHLCYLCIFYCSEASREDRAGNRQAAKNQSPYKKVGGMCWVQFAHKHILRLTPSSVHPPSTMTRRRHSQIPFLPTLGLHRYNGN